MISIARSVTHKSPDPKTVFELFVFNCLLELYIQLWGIILVLYLQYSLLLTELTKTPFPWTKSLFLYFLLYFMTEVDDYDSGLKYSGF